MRKPNAVLVPTDLSGFSLEAFDYAQEIAGMFDAGIIVVFVIDKGTQKPKARYEVNEAEVEARRKLVEFLMDRKIVPDRVRLEIRHGHPAEEIVKTAQELRVDLIVMSTHGRTGLSHVLIGSVAEHVVRMSNAPVLTVKPAKVQDANELREEDIKSNLNLN